MSDPGRDEIEAIRRYRNLTGASLKEAKAAVEAGRSAGVPFAAGLRPRSAMPDDATRAEILVKLSANQKIAAIKDYREATGASLRDAKTAVEEIGAQYGIVPAAASGSAATSILAFVAVVAVIAGVVLFLYRFASP